MLKKKKKKDRPTGSPAWSFWARLPSLLCHQPPLSLLLLCGQPMPIYCLTLVAGKGCSCRHCYMLPHRFKALS